MAHSLLPLGDEAAISLFFGEGMAAFERSISGDMLARQELYAYDSMDCPRCHGTGYVGARECIVCTRPHKPGYSGRPGTISTLRRDAGDPTLTARPTGSSLPSVPEAPNEQLLLLVSSVSRRLRRLTRTQQAVLEAYYGDKGSAWASAQPCTVCAGCGMRNGSPCQICKGSGHIERVRVGRLFAVYLLTRLARQLLGKQITDERPDQQLYSLWLASQHGMGKQPRGFWEAVDLDARRLLVDAAVSWRKLDDDRKPTRSRVPVHSRGR